MDLRTTHVHVYSDMSCMTLYAALWDLAAWDVH